MKSFQLLLLIILVSDGALTAPVREGEGLEGEEQKCSGEDTIQQWLDDILEQGLLSNDDNKDKIKRAFNWDPNTVKICVQISYEISCIDQESQVCTDCFANTPYISIWTSFDPKTLAGSLLLHYGSISYDIFGFEWDGACNITDESTVPLSISVPPLTRLCAIEDRKMYITKSLNKLTTKMLQYANNSNTNQYYSTNDENSHIIEYYTGMAVSGFLCSIALITLISVAKEKIESKEGKKTKAYFQYWAFHFFIYVFKVYIMLYSNRNRSIYIILVPIVISSILTALTLFLNMSRENPFDVNTPTRCLVCQCCPKASHTIVILISMITLTCFILLCIFFIPDILFVYYIYPTRTLARLPLLINAVLYINTLLAILLYQCENCWYPCYKRSLHSKEVATVKEGSDTVKEESDKVKDKSALSYKFHQQYKRCCEILIREPLFEKRNKDHDTFYKEVRKNDGYVKSVTNICYPAVTMAVLGFLVVSINAISDLILLHHQNNNQLELIMTLVPTVLLLFGSWFNLDIFFVDEKEKSEKELFTEMLDELKKINSRDETIVMEDDQTPPSTEEKDEQTTEVNQSDPQVDDGDASQIRSSGEESPALGDGSGTQFHSTHEETGSHIQVASPRPPKGSQGNKAKKANEKTPLIEKK